MVDCILRRPKVSEGTGLSTSTIYDKMNPNSPRYDASFPKPVRMGANAVGWKASEIQKWIEGLNKETAA